MIRLSNYIVVQTKHWNVDAENEEMAISKVINLDESVKPEYFNLSALYDVNSNNIAPKWDDEMIDIDNLKNISRAQIKEFVEEDMIWSGVSDVSCLYDFIMFIKNKLGTKLTAFISPSFVIKAKKIPVAVLFEN